MICPVCKRDLAPTLSICLTCGAMMHDTVREELETKIGRVSGPLLVRKAEPPKPAPAKIEAPPVPKRKSEPARPATAELAKKETSPTLIEFQSKNPSVPDWRLQLQNSIRQRSGTGSRETVQPTTEPVAVERPPAASGSKALKPRYAEQVHRSIVGNERLANALRRIETSRKTYHVIDRTPAPAANAASRPATPNRSFPFNIVSRSGDIGPQHPRTNPVPAPPKPRLVSSFKIEKKRYDTNKLPPIPQPAKLSSSFDSTETEIEATVDRPRLEHPMTSVTDTLPGDAGIFETEMEPVEELDDLAPFSMRFAAGLFDFIIAGFGTLIVLSPFMASGGTWLSFSGLLAYSAAFSIFMFLYLTASIGWWGKTFGMRIFSLELIDAEENVYPTIHQAAVNSAVYLLSMAFAGLGFVTILFNEEKRAAHDLVSGTILIRDI